MEKVKSVSGNLRIEAKTFCENAEVRHEKGYFLTVNGFKGYEMSTKSHVSLTNKIALMRHPPNPYQMGGGQICPTQEIGYFGYILAFKTTKSISRDPTDTRADPQRVHDQP